MRYSRTWQVAALLLALLVVTGFGAGFIRVCTAPLEFSPSRFSYVPGQRGLLVPDIHRSANVRRTPPGLAGLAQRDAVAYPGHVILASVLTDTGCDTSAAGLQWLKAGAHARTADEIAFVSGGLSRVAARSDSPEDFALRLCILTPRGFANLEQARAFFGAGLTCPGSTPDLLP